MHKEEELAASPNSRDQAKAKLQKRKRAAMRGTILALGVLIGFAWEKSFDTAVDDTAEKESNIMPPSFIKVVLAMLLATVVLPAWRWYILPEVVRLGGFSDPADEEAEDAVEKAEEGYAPPMLPETMEFKMQEMQKKIEKLELEKGALADEVNQLRRKVNELQGKG